MKPSLPVPTYLAFSCSADILPPPGALILFDASPLEPINATPLLPLEVCQVYCSVFVAISE
jgi:hypothetical protein